MFTDIVGYTALMGKDEEQAVELLKKNDALDITVSGGGIIPNEDIPRLQSAGIAGVFGPGTRTQEIVDFIKTTVNN